MEQTHKKCPTCYGTGIDRLKSGFVKVHCKECKGTGFSAMETHQHDKV